MYTVLCTWHVSIITNIFSKEVLENIIVVDDINIDISRESSDLRSIGYLNLMTRHDMLLAHNLHTQNRSCLDHVLSKTRSQLSAMMRIIPSRPLQWYFSNTLHVHISTNSCKTYRKLNYTALESDIIGVDFRPLCDIVNVNMTTAYFTKTIGCAIAANSIPKRGKKNSKQTIKLCVTLGLLKCTMNRDIWI